MPTRRHVATHLGAIVGGAIAFANTQSVAANAPVYVGCRRTPTDGYRFSGFDPDGNRRFDIALPDRGHDVAFHPARPHAVLFARRPGTFALAVNIEQGIVEHRFHAAKDRHFYGHGVFSPSGSVLISAENDFASSEGRLGLRDPKDTYRQIGELPSHGIGPHDVHLLPDEKTLAVANGGIRTHPDRDREKLNIDEMRPNLALVDLASGLLIDRYELPSAQHKLSIRHLDVAKDGRIAIGMQYEGGKRDNVPLVALFDGNTIRPFEPSANQSRAMRHYVGSIAFSADGQSICATAPRANMATLWDAQTGRHIATRHLKDAGGVATHSCGFVITGQNIATLPDTHPNAECNLPIENRMTNWDNHLSRRQA